MKLDLTNEEIKFIAGALARHAKRNHEAAQLDYTPDTRKELRARARKEADEANRICNMLRANLSL